MPVTTALIAPGSTIGVLGGGQLGRMFAMAARRLGYRVHTLAPEHDTPTGQIADVEVVASYDDIDRVREFARAVDVVTFEFENVPIEAIDAIESLAPVRPSAVALHTAQQRAREKTFLADHGFPTAPFARASSLDELWNAVARIGTPREHVATLRQLQSRMPKEAANYFEVGDDGSFTIDKMVIVAEPAL